MIDWNVNGDDGIHRIIDRQIGPFDGNNGNNGIDDGHTGWSDGITSLLNNTS